MNIREKIIKSIAHHWEQESTEEEKNPLVKEMLVNNETIEKIVNYSKLSKEEILKFITI